MQKDRRRKSPYIMSITINAEEPHIPMLNCNILANRCGVRGLVCPPNTNRFSRFFKNRVALSKIQPAASAMTDN